ncbi:hypothetical protein [Nodularia sphaerocarpa]|nr:hypothetical protein [Nodularia sphaerocarpa]
MGQLITNLSPKEQSAIKKPKNNVKFSTVSRLAASLVLSVR